MESVTSPGPMGEWTQDRWASMARVTGTVGIVAVVLLFAPIIAISTVGEPPLEADSADAADFFRATQASWAQAAEAAASLGARRVVPVHLDSWAHFTEDRHALQRAFEKAGLADVLTAP